MFCDELILNSKENYGDMLYVGIEWINFWYCKMKILVTIQSDIDLSEEYIRTQNPRINKKVWTLCLHALT